VAKNMKIWEEKFKKFPTSIESKKQAEQATSSPSSLEPKKQAEQANSSLSSPLSIFGIKLPQTPSFSSSILVPNTPESKKQEEKQKKDEQFIASTPKFDPFSFTSNPPSPISIKTPDLSFNTPPPNRPLSFKEKAEEAKLKLDESVERRQKYEEELAKKEKEIDKIKLASLTIAVEELKDKFKGYYNTPLEKISPVEKRHLQLDIQKGLEKHEELKKTKEYFDVRPSTKAGLTMAANLAKNFLDTGSFKKIPSETKQTVKEGEKFLSRPSTQTK
jgi:hypothetical protein